MGTVSRWISLAVLRLCPHRRVGGIRVVFSDLDVERDLCVERLTEALYLLAVLDPLRHRRVVKYVRQIVVWAGHYTAADDLGGMQLSSSHLLEISEPQLASVLVHESVHLRIARLGIAYDERLRERIERRCVREQASFLRRVPDNGEELATEAESALELAWWTAESHRADVDRLATDFGIPQWILPLLKPGD